MSKLDILLYVECILGYTSLYVGYWLQDIVQDLHLRIYFRSVSKLLYNVIAKQKCVYKMEHQIPLN